MHRFQEWGSSTPAGTVWALTVEGDHRVVPDGALDLIWGNGEFLLAGPDTLPYERTYESETHVWGFRFSPGVAASIFGIPAEELAGTLNPVEDLVPLPAATGLMRLGPTIGLHAFVQALWNRADVDTTRVALASSIDADARAGLSVRAIAERHCLTERSLLRFCREAFGYGPKTLTTVHRFQRALALAADGTPFAEAAVRAGYSDQAHLAREVKRFAGMTLTELLDPNARPEPSRVTSAVAGWSDGHKGAPPEG